MDIDTLINSFIKNHFSAFADYDSVDVLYGHEDTYIITARFNKPSLVGVIYLAYKVECEAKIAYPQCTVTSAAGLDKAQACIVLIIRQGG